MKYSHNILACGLSLALLFSSCKKDEEEPFETAADYRTYLEDEAEDQHIPGMAVLVFDHEEVLLEEYLGVANRQTGEALTSDHVFLTASISKTITATALLRLYDAGHFQLDDPINNYLPFQVNVPGYTTPVTFRMLLTHTSGIADGPSLDNQYFNNQDSPNDLTTFMESYLVPGGSNYDANANFHNFEPGTQHEYSNEGTALIAVLVEQISGQPFDQYCRTEIFQPLGMDHTFWRLSNVTHPKVVPYDYVNGSYTTHEHYTFTDYPNGGLRTNVRDMHTFLLTLIQGGVHQNYTLLNSGTVNAMLSPQIPQINNEVGWHFFIMNSEEQLWGHDGGEKGVATIMGWNKSNGTGCIVFTNQGEAFLDDIFLEGYLFGKD